MAYNHKNFNQEMHHSATMGTKVIALTGINSEETLLKAFKHGVDDYMNKPFTASELEVRISRLLK